MFCLRQGGVLLKCFISSVRMEFGDFCRYFTNVVLCHLMEKALLWPGSHWREESCFGEWAPAPGASLGHGTRLRPRGPTAGRGGGRQRGGRKEPRLGKAGARGGGGKERVEKKKAGGANEEEEQGSWSEEEESQSGEVEGEGGTCVDKRSRCGGCINHMETFLHNPQVRTEDKYTPWKTNSVFFCFFYVLIILKGAV